MTERGANREKMSSGGGGSGSGAGGAAGSTGASGANAQQSKPVPMKLFAAWEDRTPSNCIPRLCSLVITRLTVLSPLPGDVSSVSVAVKMQSSKRILRSHEIPFAPRRSNSCSNSSGLVTTQSCTVSGAAADGSNSACVGGLIGPAPLLMGPTTVNTTISSVAGGLMTPATAISSATTVATTTTINSGLNAIAGGNNNNFSTYGGGGGGGFYSSSNNQNFSNGQQNNNIINNNNTSSAIMEADLDLNFSLQYPHFIKRDGNRLLITLQRRKKYKTRTILGYKTLAEGVIRMDAVLQKSMDMTVELHAPGKGNRPGCVLATVRAERVSSIPVDHDNKNISNVLIADRNNDYSDEDEEGDFISSGDDNEDGPANATAMMRNFADKSGGGGGVGGGVGGGGRGGIGGGNFRKLDPMNDNDPEDVMLGQGAQCDSDSDFDPKDKNARTKISRQRNFKQKIVALLKRFKVPEEIEESRHAGRLRPGHQQLDELFQELDELSCGDGDDSGPDVDSLSIGSTPKPSLRPFFANSRNMMHEHIKEERLNEDKLIVGETVSSRIAEKNDNSSGNEAVAGGGGLTDLLDSSMQSDIQCISSPPGGDVGPAEKERKLRLMFRSNTTTSNSNASSAAAATAAANALSSSGTGAGGALSTSLGQGPLSAGCHTPNSSNPNNAGANSVPGVSSLLSSAPKKKQSLSLSATEPRSMMWESCLSPTNIEPRKSLLDQLARTFATDETQSLPDSVCIVGPTEVHGQGFVSRLAAILSTQRPLFSPLNSAEVKSIVQAVLNKIQKYCNSTAKPPTTIKVLLLGGDWLQGMVLRHYVELLAARPPDWVNHLRFYIVSFGTSSIARYLSAVDASYAMLFGVESNWSQLCERAVAGGVDQTQARPEVIEIVNRIQKYLHNMGPCTQIPIAEAMVNYKEEESCHIFVPFVSDVRLGCPEGPQLSMELDESSQLSSSILSSSPPNGRLSPPPVMSSQGGGGGQGGGSSSGQQQSQQSSLTAMPQQQSPQESYELQIDYWPVMQRNESKEARSANKTVDQGKNSIKSTFRSLQVWRLSPCKQSAGELLSSHGLTLLYATKEKKQKIMRLGKKKEKDRDAEKEHCVESVARLICSPKQSHPVPLLVYIDGTEWSGVKFFQLSSQWQTHVKNFPVALIGAPLAAAEN